MRNLGEQRPDLALIVTGPEEPGEGRCPRIVYVSGGVRPGAAPTETYLIRVGTDQLREAGVPVPQGTADVEDADGVATWLTAANDTTNQIKQTVRTLDGVRLGQVVRASDKFTTGVRAEVVQALSRRVSSKMFPASGSSPCCSGRPARAARRRCCGRTQSPGSAANGHTNRPARKTHWDRMARTLTASRMTSWSLRCWARRPNTARTQRWAT